MSDSDKLYITQTVLPVVKLIGESLDRLGFNHVNNGRSDYVYPGAFEKIAMDLDRLVSVHDRIADALEKIAEAITER